MNLQNRLRSLSSGLVGLRNCIHDQQNGAPAMEVAISVDNGLNRVDSGSSLSPLNGASVAFSTAATDGSLIMNGIHGNGVMASSSTVPPTPPCSSATLTTSAGLTENAVNGTQQQSQSNQFPHGRFNMKEK